MRELENMKEVFFKKFFIFFAVFALLFFVLPVHAQVGSAIQQQTNAFVGVGGANIASPQDPRTIVARIILILLTVIGTLFLAYTVYAGYLIMTSAGDEEKVNKGKSTIRTAVIGVMITLSAYAITQFVTSALLDAQGDQSGFRATGTTDDHGQRGYNQRNDPFPSQDSPYVPGALNY